MGQSTMVAASRGDIATVADPNRDRDGHGCQALEGPRKWQGDVRSLCEGPGVLRNRRPACPLIPAAIVPAGGTVRLYMAWAWLGEAWSGTARQARSGKENEASPMENCHVRIP